jgi:hypothetical protein
MTAVVLPDPHQQCAELLDQRRRWTDEAGGDVGVAQPDKAALLEHSPHLHNRPEWLSFVGILDPCGCAGGDEPLEGRTIPLRVDFIRRPRR